MILHRLRLNNFRGVKDREIRFPDHGVVVVCGPNEIGKSSMLEALDLLLTYRDRSTHRDVKQVRPANADAGAQVEAEISTGPYRFVYRKRFHKKAMTELDIIEPKREQLVADEAHERVEAMLKETVDTKLWEAQRVLQSASTDSVNLSGSDALARALDAAAGDAAASPSGADPLLIDRIDTEYQRYFTKTGKPTKEWKAAIERVTAAEEHLRRCRVAVDEVNERVARHEELTETVSGAEAALTPAVERLATAQHAHAAVTELAKQLGQAHLAAEAATARSRNSTLANGQRQELIVEVNRRTETLAGLNVEFAAARDEHAQLQQAAGAAAQAAAEAAAALSAAQQRRDTAQAVMRACAARGESEKLAGRLRRIDDAEKALAKIASQLDSITITDDVLADIEESADLVARFEALLQADAGTVEFTAPGDLDITVDGVTRTLTPGEPWTQPSTAPVVVEIPGVLSVHINPGATAVKRRADLQAAEHVLREALEQGGVTDLAAARSAAQCRQELTVESGKLAATLDGLRGGDDVEQMRAELADLRATASQTDVDADAAAAESSAAAEVLTAAGAEVDSRQQAASAAHAACVESSTRETILRARIQSAEAELAADLDRLTTLRAAVADEAVAAEAAADAAMQKEADDRVAALAERYAAADPAAVEAELVAATTAVEAITAELDAAKLELHNITVELGVIGSEGRQGQLDDAEAECERAHTEQARVAERASAAQLLRDTMIRHRDNTRARYVQPYRAELERLGREVFGSSFEVDVDTELTIQTRTLDGCTVPYDSLSGGAKEQLGILARLAGAALVSAEDTVPVVIDDALGFSDPDRLEKMGAVLNTVGDRGQVIVLTCSPGRYDSVADAELIELTA